MTLSTAGPQSFDARSEIKQATGSDAAAALGRGPEAGLLSREAAAAVDTAFDTLAQSVKKHEPTLENLVRETLQPMLKLWLDENLPSLVERIVQSEIERVARGHLSD
jgi:cell pole-organizing protein PopZ